MKQSILLVGISLWAMTLTAQTSFPKYSIGTDLSVALEYQPTVWLNLKYFKKSKNNEYQSFILDAGYVVGESKIYGKSLDRDKVNLKFRVGSSTYKKKTETLWIYTGFILSFKFIHFSKVGDFIEEWDYWNGETINTTMLRKSIVR